MDEKEFSDEDLVVLNALRVETLYNNGVIPAVVTMFGALVLFVIFWVVIVAERGR